jgi:hypothetical protein
MVWMANFGFFRMVILELKVTIMNFIRKKLKNMSIGEDVIQFEIRYNHIHHGAKTNNGGKVWILKMVVALVIFITTIFMTFQVNYVYMSMLGTH